MALDTRLTTVVQGRSKRAKIRKKGTSSCRVPSFALYRQNITQQLRRKFCGTVQVLQVDAMKGNLTEVAQLSTGKYLCFLAQESLK